VSFKNGQMVEFREELGDLYQPAPGSPEAQRLAEVRGAEQLRHPDRVPKIQLPLFMGERVPVRYDHADRSNQARASRDPDPLCQFCQQPIPVTPAR